MILRQTKTESEKNERHGERERERKKERKKKKDERKQKEKERETEKRVHQQNKSNNSSKKKNNNNHKTVENHPKTPCKENGGPGINRPNVAENNADRELTPEIVLEDENERSRISKNNILFSEIPNFVVRRRRGPGIVVKRGGPGVIPVIFKDGETTIKIKFAILRGLGVGSREGNCPKNAVFRGKGHDNKIFKVQISLSKHFVVIAQAPAFCGTGVNPYIHIYIYIFFFFFLGGGGPSFSIYKLLSGPSVLLIWFFLFLFQICFFLLGERVFF